MRRAETLEIDRGPADLVADLNVSGQGDEMARCLVTNVGQWAKVWTLDPPDWFAATRRIVGDHLAEHHPPRAADALQQGSRCEVD